MGLLYIALGFESAKDKHQGVRVQTRNRAGDQDTRMIIGLGDRLLISNDWRTYPYEMNSK